MKLRIVEINGKKTAKQNETKNKATKRKNRNKKKATIKKKQTNKQTQNAGISERLMKVTPTLFIQL